jgi:hypothetical protein
LATIVLSWSRVDAVNDCEPLALPPSVVEKPPVEAAKALLPLSRAITAAIDLITKLARLGAKQELVVFI